MNHQDISLQYADLSYSGGVSDRPKQNSSSAEDNEPIPKGTKAPAFSLNDTPDQKVSLSDFKGRQPVVLIFYPADFSPVCGDELAIYNEVLPEFQKYHAQLLGISVDNVWTHLAFAKDRNFHFPLLSDFNPKGEVSKKYHAYDEKTGESKRALYVIDKDGVIVWSYLSPVGINPGADGVLNALSQLEKKPQQKQNVLPGRRRIKNNPELKKDLKALDPTLDKHTMNIKKNLSEGVAQTIPDPDDIPGGYNPDGSKRLTILQSIAEAKLEKSEKLLKPRKKKKHK